VAAIGLADKRLGRRCLQRRIQNADDLIDGHGRIWLVEGSVTRSAAACGLGPTNRTASAVRGASSPTVSHVRLNMRSAFVRKGDPRWTLPSHESEDENQDRASAHGEGKQRTPPSSGRKHHHLSANPVVCLTPKERQ
jgi:hypothetical protein